MQPDLETGRTGFVVRGAPNRGCCCSAGKPRLSGCVQLSLNASELSGLVSLMSPPHSGSSAVLWGDGSSKGNSYSPFGASHLPSPGLLQSSGCFLSLLLPYFTALPWLRIQSEQFSVNRCVSWHHSNWQGGSSRALTLPVRDLFIPRSLLAFTFLGSLLPVQLLVPP